MEKNNDVKRVLATKCNYPLLEKGKRIYDLKPGQLGVFSYETGLSLETDLPKHFYFAVGIGKKNSIAQDFRESAGTHIQKENIDYINYRPHTAEKPLKVLLKNYIADCETEYGIKLDITGSRVYDFQGYSQFTKLFMMRTSCCSDCKPTCPGGDANEITRQLYYDVVHDNDQIVKANIKPRGDVSAAGVNPDSEGNLTLEDIDKIMQYNKTLKDTSKYVYTDIEFESIPENIVTSCNSVFGYVPATDLIFNVSKIEGFKCNGEIEITQKPAFEEGSGEKVAFKEFMAEDKFYYTSSLLGSVDNIVSIVDKEENYDQFFISYHQASSNATEYFKCSETTLIAVPETDTVTIEAVKKLFKTLGFEETRIEGLNITASTDPKTTEKTSEVKE